MRIVVRMKETGICRQDPSGRSLSAGSALRTGSSSVPEDWPDRYLAAAGTAMPWRKAWDTAAYRPFLP